MESNRAQGRCRSGPARRRLTHALIGGSAGARPAPGDFLAQMRRGRIHRIATVRCERRGGLLPILCHSRFGRVELFERGGNPTAVGDMRTRPCCWVGRIDDAKMRDAGPSMQQRVPGARNQRGIDARRRASAGAASIDRRVENVTTHSCSWARSCAPPPGRREPESCPASARRGTSR
jgi:hypothetical protein